jgi:predicted anti-sigma-YlaC factor YlaD
MISCRKATELVSLQIDKPLKSLESIALNIHLLYCSACKNAKKQLIAIDQATGEFLKDDQPTDVVGIELPDDAKQRIHERIEREIDSK